MKDMVLVLVLFTFMLKCTSAEDVLMSSLTSSIGFRMLGAAASDLSGRAVSYIGDINNDGIDDVLVGARSADPDGKSAAGISYVIYGRDIPGGADAFGDIQLTTGTATLASDVGFRLLGGDIDDFSGETVGSAGDINNDGISDFIVGATGASPPLRNNAGIAYVILGRDVPDGAAPFSDIELTTGATTLATGVGFRILGYELSGALGTSVAAAGDINHDGVGDIVIGAYRVNSNRGYSYVIFGRNVPGGDPAFTDIQLTGSALPSDIGFRVLGAANADECGFAVNGAGDVNHDGIDDLLVASWAADRSAAITESGITYVIFGRNVPGGDPSFPDIQLTTGASALIAGIGFRILGAADSDLSGGSISTAGDMNGDGVTDFMIAAHIADPVRGARAGIVYVIF